MIPKENPSDEQIFAEVADILVASLGSDREEITPTARLVSTLGAESIDTLDISFRLERSFGIKNPRNRLFVKAEGSQIEEDSQVVDPTVAEICAGVRQLLNEATDSVEPPVIERRYYGAR